MGKRQIVLNLCLEFEDMGLGVEAGRRVGIRVVWCPHPQLLKVYEMREGIRRCWGLVGVAEGGEDQQVVAAVEKNVEGKERRSGQSGTTVYTEVYSRR